jgi:hypothetical protein
MTTSYTIVVVRSRHPAFVAREIDAEGAEVHLFFHSCLTNLSFTWDSREETVTRGQSRLAI